MAEREICSLEYLIGTLATAYKGIITSLSARDFCILDGDGVAVFKGTILTMPAGDYHAVLKHQGIELSRTEIRDGFFELKAPGGVVRDSRNLQIDIMQRGRHIGTFLLKKEKGDNLFISALELSEEVRGLNFGALSGRLRQKPGILKKGERIISKILSSKKDWGKFSDEIHSFSNDLFWFDRDSFYAWSGVLQRYAFLSAGKAGPGEREKAAENVLSIIELALENEGDASRLRDLTDGWLRTMQASRLDWSFRFRQVAGILSEIRRRFSDVDPGGPLRQVLNSLEERAERVPVVPSSVFDVLGKYLPDGDLSPLVRFGPKRKELLNRSVSRAKQLISAGDYAGVFATLENIEPPDVGDAEMVKTFFRVAGAHPDRGGADGFAEVLPDMVHLFRTLPEPVYRQAMAYAGDMIRRLFGLGITAACGRVLDILDAAAFEAEELVLNPEMASAVLGCGDRQLIRRYEDIVAGYVIPPPGIKGFSGETWAEIADPLHLERLSRFLRIISIDSEGLRDIMIRLICNLYVSGVFIPDDRLFQREVSAYLNSVRMDKDFLLHRMLLRRLPVFFNEVGATGNIREFTTEIDSWANDPVLYFLRKQVHVNASNYNVPLIEKIMEAWVTGETGPLKDAVPDDVLARLDPKLLAEYSAAAGQLFKKLGMLEGRELHCEKIISVREEDLMAAVGATNMTEEMKSKFLLLLKIYRGVVKKYSFAGWESADQVAPAVMGDCIRKMAELKQIIISPEKMRAEESFYFKRHIAFGIPSVMGSYHEPKFDAMAEAFGLEERVRVMVEALISDDEKKEGMVSAEDVREWIGQLDAIAGLFGYQDLNNFQVGEIITVLRTNALRLTQIVDLLRIWQKELTWMVGSFYRTFHGPLVEVLKQFPEESLPARLQGPQAKKSDFVDKAADILIREMMAGVAGLLELDRVLGVFISTLRMRILQEDDLLVTAAEERSVKRERSYYLLDDLDEGEAMELSPLIGGKAKNLVYLHGGRLRVPIAAVFAAGPDSRADGNIAGDAFESALRDAVGKIEERTGTTLGGDTNPLFLSVRSGSYISMPGILSSVLYCGMNDRTLHSMIEREGDAWLGWDSMRRFIEHYGTVVLGLEMGFFESISDSATGVTELRREDITSSGMEAIVQGYREGLAARGLSIPEDVYIQLRESVSAVYASWHSERSLRFREAVEISSHWGTSVTLMQMVYGNAPGGGASVFFTRSPSTLEKGVYGETREHATGGDLVYGRLVNRPLSRAQGARERKSLEELDPELFALHVAAASEIEEKMGGLPQEVEVTYTRMPDGRRVIHLLQSRRMEVHRGFTKRFSDVCRMQSNIIGRGAGVHGGALSGVVTFSMSNERIRALRESAGLPVILIRQAASTDDVSLMPQLGGIVTAGGGVASHASVLARNFGLTAVVGCEALEIRADESGAPYASLGGRVIREGSGISIDGSTGLIYSGTCSDFE